jgi:hypothetical protein
MPSTPATFRSTALRVLLVQALSLVGLWLLQRLYSA